MSDPKKSRQPWHLQPKDFTKKKVYAAQDWRFQMFFQYLRLSPSYALALECQNEEEFAEKLGDRERASRIWKTRSDMGNVFEVLYKEWWLSRGLSLFGVHSQKPKIELISRNIPMQSDSLLVRESQKQIKQYFDGSFQTQGRPDSVVLSIPLNQKASITVRQLKKLLTEIKAVPPVLPEVAYPLEANKMRYQRLMDGVRLVYMRSAKPDEELWRVASRAKISRTHILDPSSPKKDARSAEARRMLTIMASRLLHDSITIAENAAMGIFPSTQSVRFEKPDFKAMGERLNAMVKWERARQAEIRQREKSDR